MRRSTNSTAASCVAALIVGAAVFGVAGRAPQPQPRALAAAGRSSVSVTTPAPVAGPPLITRPVARWTGPAPAPAVKECPQMTNPGGGFVGSRPGPDSTDGSVSIPALGMRAPLVRVGFDASWRMVLPKNARDVAWLDQGEIPGATRNVVLAGHIDWGGATGPFATVERLRPGDVITLALHGRTWKYAVRYSCRLPYDSRRGAQVIGYTAVPSLTMVSCTGTWNAGAGTHNQRIVVRAEQVYPPIAPTRAPQTHAKGGGRSTPSPSHTPAPSRGPFPGVDPLHNE